MPCRSGRRRLWAGLRSTDDRRLSTKGRPVLIIFFAARKRGTPPPPPPPGPSPPPPPDQSDHRAKKRNSRLGKSCPAIFGAQTFGSQTPPPPVKHGPDQGQTIANHESTAVVDRLVHRSGPGVREAVCCVWGAVGGAGVNDLCSGFKFRSGLPPPPLQSLNLRRWRKAVASPAHRIFRISFESVSPCRWSLKRRM